MTKRTKEQDLWHHRGFAAGIAVACSTIFGVWGESVAVEEILGGANLTTRAKMKALGVDNYDLDILRPVFKRLREHRTWKRTAKPKPKPAAPRTLSSGH
jgi:hypothetical protein